MRNFTGFRFVCLLVVCAGIVAAAAPAAPAGGTDASVPDGFSLRFVPETAPPSDRYPAAPDFGAGSVQPLSVRRAVLYSLLLPGLGDYYAGRTGRATVFFVAEAGIWTSFAALKTQSSRREDTFQQMAVDFAGITATGLSDDFYSTIGQYNTHEEYEAEFKKEHRIDIYPDVGYEAMERYYVENRVTDFQEWAWQSNEQRQQFRELRSSSRLADRRSGYMIALAAANRVVAALFAYQAVRSHNDGIGNAQSGGYRLDFSTPSKRFAAAVFLIRTF